MNEYKHTEMHNDNLRERLTSLTEVDKSWQTPERRAIIQHEIGCLVFEQMSRYSETHPETQL